jgi:small conductance mechanosensitive channel
MTTSGSGQADPARDEDATRPLAGPDGAAEGDVDGRGDDPTRARDISYYRDSALARRLTAQAARQAQRARREAIVLLPLVVALVLIWRFRQELFGADVPVRIAAAILLALIGWRFARDIGRAMGPRLLARFDPGTASTIGFVVQLITLLVVAVLAFRVVELDPRALALGGAFTAVILGLAAQNTLGNVIAGTVLLAARPFRIGERVRMQGGTLGGEVEGTIASLGLVYTTLARGQERILVPNNAALAATIVPLREPAGVDLRVSLPSSLRPSELQRLLHDRVTTPTRDSPHITLEEVRGDEVEVRVRATPLNDDDGPRLADEVLVVVSELAAQTLDDDESPPRDQAG